MGSSQSKRKSKSHFQRQNDVEGEGKISDGKTNPESLLTEQLKDDNDNLLHGIKTLVSEFKQQNKELDKLKVDNANFRREFKELRAKIALLEQKKTATVPDREIRMKLEDEIQKLRATNDKLKSENANTISELEEKLKRKEGKGTGKSISELTTSQELQMKTIKDLEDKLKGAKEERARLSKINDSLKAESQSRLESIKDLREGLKKAEESTANEAKNGAVPDQYRLDEKEKQSIMNALSKGDLMTKYPNGSSISGKKRKMVKIDARNCVLTYQDVTGEGKVKGSPSKIYLPKVSGLMVGKVSKAFDRSVARLAAGSRCFSLQVKTRTYDFEADNNAMLQRWIMGLVSVLKEQRTQPISVTDARDPTGVVNFKIE